MSYPPPPGYGEYPPGYGQQPPRQLGKGFAVTALVLGILALISFWTVIGGVLFGILAVIFGIVAAVKVKKGTGSGGVMAGFGIGLGLLGLIGAVVVGLFTWTLFEESGGRDLLDCLNDAGGDQSKIDQCNQDFEDELEQNFSVTLTPTPTP